MHTKHEFCITRSTLRRQAPCLNSTGLALRVTRPSRRFCRALRVSPATFCGGAGWCSQACAPQKAGPTTRYGYKIYAFCMKTASKHGTERPFGRWGGDRLCAPSSSFRVRLLAAPPRALPASHCAAGTRQPYGSPAARRPPANVKRLRAGVRPVPTRTAYHRPRPLSTHLRRLAARFASSRRSLIA